MTRASETVEGIRATLPTIRDHDVFKSSNGGYLLDTGESVISVAPNGSTSEITGMWQTGWDA